MLRPALGFGLALLLAACAQTSPRVEPARATPASARLAPAFAGSWRFDAAKSTSIDPWSTLGLRIARDGDAVALVRQWTGSREGGASTDSSRFLPGGAPVVVRLDQWADNRHLGAFLTSDSSKTVVGRVEDGGATLVTETRLDVIVQQGEIPIRIYTEYRLSPGGNRLDVLELRSTRPAPIHYVFDRAQP